MIRQFVTAIFNRILDKGSWNPDRAMRFIVLQSKVLGVIPIGVRGPSGGSIQHYYHFLFDLLLPVDTMFSRYSGNYSIALPDCGPFNTICKDLYKERVITWDESGDYHDVRQATLLGMEPHMFDVDKRILIEFRDRIRARVQPKTPRETVLVLVIERVTPGDFYKSERSVMKSSGAQRRSIVNHEDWLMGMKTILKGDIAVKNVKLEEFSFFEQVELFSAADIIIGQHGAGLANQLWMDSGKVIVEIRQNDTKDHFKKLSRLCDHEYFAYYVDSDHPKIDVHKFNEWIKKCLDTH